MGLVEDKYLNILERALELGKTSSILRVEDKTFTYARNQKYLKKLLNEEKEIAVAIPEELWEFAKPLPNNIEVFLIDKEDNIEYIWTYIHNEVNKDVDPAPIIIGNNCYIHETAVIGVHGNTYALTPEGERIHLKEIGGVRIEDNVDVEALSIVHRSCFNNTVIGKGSKVCVHCNIGHNVRIGKNSFIAPGVLLGGGTQVGDDCFVWQGVITRSYVTLGDRVIVAAGSVVMHDLLEPGIYLGQPAKYLKPYDETLR
jgi:acetyltransferase-like isoleucine patch superfamily enzyme